jgi:hypothetical protein
MKLLEAIAYSGGNKAEGMNDQGHRVIVQERYTSTSQRWYHVWHLHNRQVVDSNIALDDLEALKNLEADPEADYWSPVK